MEPIPKQGALDLSGIDDDRFFHEAETRIVEALRTFAETATGSASVRRSLFAGDAAQGVALLDLARTRFDVVLMNPPFGQFTSRSLEVAKELYPDGSNDIYACFVSRARELTVPDSLIGVLSSRLGFFLDGLEEWRSCLMTNEGGLSLLLDLGYGVLDDALVETAAYIIDSRPSSNDVTALRLLSYPDKAGALINILKLGESDFMECRDVFVRRRNELSSIPGKVLAYWLPEELLHLLSRREDLGEENIVAFSGLQTDDDFRFLRLWWETTLENSGWLPFAKGGEYLPYADDLHLVVNWRPDGHEMKAFVESKYRQWSRHIKNTDRFFECGLTYTERTTSDMSIRPLPCGAIFSVSGPCIQGPERAPLEIAWAALSSRPGRALIDTLVGSGDTSKSGTAARHYRTGLIASFPSVSSSVDANALALLRDNVWTLYRANLFQRVRSEAHRLFIGLPHPAQPKCSTLLDWSRALLQMEVAQFRRAARASLEIDNIVGAAFGLNSREALTAFAGPHPSDAVFTDARRIPPDASVSDVLGNFLTASDEAATQLAFQAGLSGRLATKRSFFFSRELELACFVSGARPDELSDAATQVPPQALEARATMLASQLLSLALGSVFGRWKNIVVDADQAERALERVDPFSELPLCPPAAGRGSIPREVVVDDPGHTDDIESLTSAVLQNIKTAIPDLVQELESVTGFSLRDYYRAEFFTQHLAVYSNSRRRAPIYVQIATLSTNYSVWMYLHNLTKDTLYKIQSEYVAPKLLHEGKKLETLRANSIQTLTASERKQLATQEGFVEELRTLLEELKRVAPLWNPTLDDGAVLMMAPLWRLVPHHKPWQKELKSKWDELAAGKYDWAHLAHASLAGARRSEVRDGPQPRHCAWA